MSDGHQDPAALVRALARELAAFQQKGAPRQHHLGWGFTSLCPAYPSPGRGCSPRCARVTYLLAEAAAYLHCPTQDLYAGKREP